MERWRAGRTSEIARVSFSLPRVAIPEVPGISEAAFVPEFTGITTSWPIAEAHGWRRGESSAHRRRRTEIALPVRVKVSRGRRGRTSSWRQRRGGVGCVQVRVAHGFESVSGAGRRSHTWWRSTGVEAIAVETVRPRSRAGAGAERSTAQSVGEGSGWWWWRGAGRAVAVSVHGNGSLSSALAGKGPEVDVDMRDED